MTSYQEVFGGSTIYPSQTTFLDLGNFSEDVVLSWGTEQQIGGPVVADVIEFGTATANLNIDMPDARQASTGPVALFNNVGAETVTVRDAGGNTIVAIESGDAWYVYLADNTTENGTWRTTQFGAGTSSANAAALAGAGLKAISLTLNAKIDVDDVNTTPTTLVDGDRARLKRWTGGVGTFNLPDPGVVGADWYTRIRNSGSGNLTVTPPSGTIDGLSSKTFRAGDSATIVTDGTDYYTVGFGQTLSTIFDHVSINIAGTGTYTLSGNELDRISYSLTGTLTGNREVIVPNRVQQYWVSNETSGAFTVTVKTASGAGVEIPQGSSRILYSDGIDVIAAENVVPLPVARGGTGLTTIAEFEILYASGDDELATLAPSTTPTQYLSNNGGTGEPTWSFINLSNGVENRLVTFTRLPTGSALSVLGRSVNSSGNLAPISAGSDDQVLRRSGSAVGFGAVNLNSPNATVNALLPTRGGTGQTSVDEGDLLYGSASNVWSRLARVSGAGLRALLNTGGTGNPAWDRLRFALGSAIVGNITLALTDGWTIKRFSLASPTDVEIPDEATVDFEVGTCIIFDTLVAADTLTISPDVGVVLKCRGVQGDVDLPPGYVALLIKVGFDSWSLFSDFPVTAGEGAVFSGHIGDDGSTGNVLPSGWSASYDGGSELYTLTHNLGHTNYQIVFSAFTDGVAPVDDMFGIRIFSKNNNTLTYMTYRSADTTTEKYQADVDFILRISS